MVGDDRTGFSPDDRIRSSQISSQRKTQTTSRIISQSHYLNISIVMVLKVNH